MKNNKMKRLFAAAAGIGLCLAMLPAAFAAEYGQPDITAQTTMKQLRENPSVRDSGYYTYSNEWSETDHRYDDTPLLEYVGAGAAQDAADGMNLMIENYNSGVQVTWQVYSDEEIAANPQLGMVQLYYFPAKTAGAKYALVVPGNGGPTTAELTEGAAAAAQLHELGYAVFVLRYRSFWDATDNAPLVDIANAVSYVESHAEQFAVSPENYAIVGFSSGGQVVGLLGSDSTKFGWKAFGIPQPAALLLGYPINNFAEVKPVYRVLIDPVGLGWRYYQTNISSVVNENYTPIYFWNGKNDLYYRRMGYCLQSAALKKALDQYHVPYVYHEYDNAPHAVSTGRGTDAEGWLTEAAAFWEEQCR